MFIHNKKVLIAGVGTTGCEILKILLFYDCDITLMDHDTVMITDLNRQFFSREKDVGNMKVSVVKEYFRIFYGKTLHIIDKSLFDMDISQSDMQFDIIFCCFDNLESRMELNIRASTLGCIIIDLGIEDQFVHVKRVVFGRDACLYCMKDLYTNNRFYNFCSLRGSLRREDQIYTMLQRFHQEKQNMSEQRTFANIKNASNKKIHHTTTKINEKIVMKVVNAFNSMNDQKTDEQEVIGIRDNIIANTCYTGSIAASMALLVLQDDKSDFWFYNGMKKPYILKIKVEKDEQCLICGNDNQ